MNFKALNALNDDVKCPSRMIGKIILKNYPNIRKPALHPLERVNMDAHRLLLHPLKGLLIATVDTDAVCDVHQDETDVVCKSWYAEIAGLLTSIPISELMP